MPAKLENCTIDMGQALEKPLCAIAQAISDIARANGLLAQAILAMANGIETVNVTGIKMDAPHSQTNNYYRMPSPDEEEEDEG
jgi:hypothetical protein